MVAVLIFLVFCIEITVAKFYSVDSDQRPNSVTSEMGLHYMHNTPKGIAGLKRVIWKGCL